MKARLQTNRNTQNDIYFNYFVDFCFIFTIFYIFAPILRES